MNRNPTSSYHKRLQHNLLALLSTGALLVSTSVFAGKPVIVDVDISKKSSSGSRTIMATVRHADSGWKHYADAIEISTPEGVILRTRVLAHPHVNEQPFTRGASGINIPEGVRKIRVRAKDSVHGFGEAVQITVPEN